jgi:Fe2+ or Zn2+ uptake regulation protein
MTNLRVFVGLLKLTESVAGELGLGGLTASDRKILELLWENYSDEDAVFTVTYGDLIKNSEQSGFVFSKAQLYKSLSKMVKLGLVKKVGSERSRTYRFIY